MRKRAMERDRRGTDNEEEIKGNRSKMNRECMRKRAKERDRRGTGTKEEGTENEVESQTMRKRSKRHRE